MAFVYHRVPKDMLGTILYPMNRLENIDKDLFSQYRSGYIGREKILKRKIPYLDCLWNDVIHCCPVHPQKIIEALESAGVKDIHRQKYFELDTEVDIDIKNAVIFFRDCDGENGIRFEKASDVDWEKVDVIPKLTLDYYDEIAKSGEPPFVYHGIPHLLYKGEIETKTLKTVDTLGS